MTFKEVETMVASTGLPHAYHHFKGTGVHPPFICFFYGSSNDLIADNTNYQKIETLYVELYSNSKDFGLEATVEGVLSSNGLVWSREETWIPDELLYEVIYTMDVVISPEPSTS